MAVSYEWDVESDIDGDIEHNHVESFSRAANCAEESDSVVLVRDESNERDGRTGRSWAYIDKASGKLPEFFENAYGSPTGFRVPKRFHEEVERHLQKNWTVRTYSIGNGVIVWYERSHRCWYGIKKDAEGNQIGDSIHASTRKLVEQHAAEKWAKPKEG